MILEKVQGLTGWTDEQICSVADISRQTLWRWRKGEYPERWSPEAMTRLAAAAKAYAADLEDLAVWLEMMA